MTYAPDAPDATRVSRPIVVSRTRVGSQSQSRPIGEMYINPALTRTRSVPSSAPQGNKPKDKKPKQDPKKKGGFKEGAKRVGRNLGNFYGKVLTRGAYVVGGVGVPGAIGYGIYRWS